MSTYRCEGFVKEVTVNGSQVTFKLEPSAPFLFEKTAENGKVQRFLLFVDESKVPNDAKIVDGDKDFAVPSGCDLNTMLIAKANRLKVRMVSSLQTSPMSVEMITVL